MKIQGKLFLYFLAIAIATTAVVGIFSYNTIRSALIKSSIEKLTSVVNIQETRVNEVVSRYLEQVRLITSRTQLRISLQNFHDTGDTGELLRIHNIIKDAGSSISSISSITIIDTEGKILVSTNASVVGSSVAETDYFKKGLQTFLVDDLFKDENNILIVRTVGPLVLKGTTLGVIEMTSSAAPILSITDDYTGLGKTGEVVLAKKNRSGDALFLSPLRFDAGAALSRALPKERVNVPMVPAVAGVEKEFLSPSTLDYRGEPVFAVTRFVEVVDWGLVAKIDQKEVFLEVLSFRDKFLFTSLFIVLFVIALSLFISNSLAAPISKLTMRARQISAGDFKVRSDITSNDEVGLLASSFNEMAKRLEGIYQGLEGKVQERTKEVESARQKLEEKLNEAERLNNLMVDRELKMIELKETLAKRGE